MKEWLKKHFIPNNGNKHRPQFLERRMSIWVGALVITLELAALLLPGVMREHGANLSTVLPGVLSALTNAERRELALEPLMVNVALSRAARLKAEDMAAKGYFAHESPDGKTPWYWLDQVGYHYDYAGENLAVNFMDSKDVTQAWMNSPSHKANIVKESYREVGTGIATGIYKGKEAVFVVQFYANPVHISSAPLAAAGNEAVMRSENYAIESIPDELSPSVETVLGAETVTAEEAPVIAQAVPQPTFIDKVTASPRHTIELVIYGAIFIAGIALLLNVLVAFHVQHKDLIIHGTLVLALLCGLLTINMYLGRSGPDITQSAAAISAMELDK
jgi:hypothetical protein